MRDWLRSWKDTPWDWSLFASVITAISVRHLHDGVILLLRPESSSFFFFIYIFKFGNPSEVWITNTLLCYIYHLRTRDLRTKVGDTSGVIFYRYNGIFLRFIIETLFLIKRTPQNGEKGHSHPIRRQNSLLRTGKYIENISDIWKKCIILDLCLFMFEKYTSGRGEARIKF